MEHFYFFILLGTLVGIFGTLVGAGGGFILMPIFFFLYPDTSSEQLTAISLAVVCCNAFSGSIIYGMKKRIDYRSGILFALASIPGAILGAMTISYFPRHVFDPIFAVFLLSVSLYLIFRPVHRNEHRPHSTNAYNLYLGLMISAVVGFLSSLLGIGGGVIHVPALVHLLGFSVHAATATSHFILAIMTFIATVVHVFQGDLQLTDPRVLLLAPSVAIGAQIGARLSQKIHGQWIMRGLAVALILVSLRILARYLGYML